MRSFYKPILKLVKESGRSDGRVKNREQLHLNNTPIPPPEITPSSGAPLPCHDLADATSQPIILAELISRLASFHNRVTSGIRMSWKPISVFVAGHHSSKSLRTES